MFGNSNFTNTIPNHIGENGKYYYDILDPKIINSLNKSDLAKFYLLIGFIKLTEISLQNNSKFIGSDATNSKTAKILSIFYGFTLISENYVKISVEELQIKVPKYKKN